MALSAKKASSLKNLRFRHDIVNDYEKGSFSDFKQLATWQPQKDDAYETMVALMNNGSHNPLEQLQWGLVGTPVSFLLPFEDSFRFVLEAIDEDNFQTAGLLCGYGTRVGREDLLGFGMRIFRTCSDFLPRIRPSLPSKKKHMQMIIGEIVAVLPLATLSERDSTYMDVVKQRLNILLREDLLQLWKLGEIVVLEQENLRLNGWRYYISCLCEMLYALDFPKATVERLEYVGNLAIQHWLSILRECEVNLHEYLEYELQVYLALPYWQRTNIDWKYSFGDTEPVPLFFCDTPYEIILDFDCTEMDEDPSVSVRLQPIENFSERIPEVKKLLDNKRKIPGQWVED